jgi:hypothetical protein
MAVVWTWLATVLATIVCAAIFDNLDTSHRPRRHAQLLFGTAAIAVGALWTSCLLVGHRRRSVLTCRQGIVLADEGESPRLIPWDHVVRAEFPSTRWAGAHLHLRDGEKVDLDSLFKVAGAAGSFTQTLRACKEAAAPSGMVLQRND